MQKLRVITCAMGGNIETTDFLKPICDELGMEFLRVSEWQGEKKHDILWQRETWLDELRKSDIVVCAARHEIQPAKSANRVVQAMSLGKPVLASPLPAYKEVIRSGENGFICDSPDEWKAALETLKDGEIRASVGRKALESVGPFSIEAVGDLWEGLLKRQALENCVPPKCDIVIPTLNNLPYLKLCVESIRRCTDWPHNIIVVASGNQDGTFDWLRRQPDVIHVLSPERMHFSKANNAGIAAGKEPYLCLLNDDTIVSKGWLTELMHEAMKPGVGAVGPFSNCDKTWLHDEEILVGGKSLVPAMSIADVEGIIPQIESHSHDKRIIARKWVAYYCTLIPRKVYDEVGPLDEGFKSGDEDVDHCKRIRDKGYRICQNFGSWVFHFGGKTRKNVDTSNHEQHQREDQENHAYFIRKWGQSPGAMDLRNEMATPLLVSAPRAPAADARPVFGIYTGQGWEPWSPLSLEEGGIGGSETCTVYTAREFHKHGWKAIVYGEATGVFDGVEYIHYSKFEEDIRARRFSLFVSSRRVDIFRLPIVAEKKVCIVHDIWLSDNPKADLWTQAVDKFFVLSPWHREFFLNHHKLADPAKTVVTRDGIDLSRFKVPLPRERGRMVYSSSPDRGLDVLLECLPRIRREVPEANVHVFYGFQNWEKVCRQRGNKAEVEWMEAIKRRLDDPGVVYRGRVGQTQLAKEMMKAEIWAHPTRFTETFAISACEQMAAGNPVVTSDVAALKTTVGDAGILIPGDNYSQAYKDRFVSEVVRMLTDRHRWSTYSLKSIEKAKAYSWDGIVEEWLTLVGIPVPKK